MRNQLSQQRTIARRANKSPHPTQRRGVSIILVGVVLVTLVAFVSLAVDIGRLRLADAQVKTAADASARAGAFALWGNLNNVNATQDVINEAATAALANPVIDSAAQASQQGDRADTGIVLRPATDVHFGTWDPATHKFTTITSSGNPAQDPRRGANAVRIEAWRHISRGTPVKMIFAPVIGINTKNAYASSIAYITGGPDRYTFVGLNFVKSNGTKATLTGGVASDGDINLGNGDVNGDARPGIGHALNQGPTSVVTGWTANLDFTLASRYPMPVVPANATLIQGTTAILSGNSDYNNPRMYKGAVPTNLTINGGYVRIYVTTGSSLTIPTTTSITYQAPTRGTDAQNAQRLQIYVTATGPTSYSRNGNGQLDAEVYAPGMDFSLGGGVNFMGWVVAKSLTFKGNSSYSSDTVRDNNTSNPNAFIVHLVDSPQVIIQ